MSLAEIRRAMVNRTTNLNGEPKMTTMTGNQTTLARAAKAFRLALDTKDAAAVMAEEFPAASKKLEEVVRLLVSEGKKAEDESKA